MPKTLVLANQTLGGEQLLAAVQERVAAGPHQFHVVVPATPVQDQAGPLGAGPPSDERAYALAAQRLDRALTEIRELGGEVDGEVGDPDAMEALRLALGRFPADEVIVSTLPLGISRWLRGNLPAKIEKACGLPVVHLVDDRAHAG
ncbi:hypothetical protein [Modestobacter sp. SYSU DS0511]